MGETEKGGAEGGSFQQGTTVSVTGPGKVNIGLPPADVDKDWVALVGQ